MLEKDNKKGNPKVRSGDLENFTKGQGVRNAPCKNKQPHNRADSNRDGHTGKTMGGESAFPTKPKKGRAGKRKTSIQTVQETSQPEITNERVNVPGRNLDRFIK